MKWFKGCDVHEPNSLTPSPLLALVPEVIHWSHAEEARAGWGVGQRPWVGSTQWCAGVPARGLEAGGRHGEGGQWGGCGWQWVEAGVVYWWFPVWVPGRSGVNPGRRELTMMQPLSPRARELHPEPLLTWKLPANPGAVTSSLPSASARPISL